MGLEAMEGASPSMVAAATAAVDVMTLYVLARKLRWARARHQANFDRLERLSADDTRILRLESDAIAGHTLKLAIVEPAPDGQLLTVERVRNRVEARLGTCHAPASAWRRPRCGSRPRPGSTTRSSTSETTYAPLPGT